MPGPFLIPGPMSFLGRARTSGYLWSNIPLGGVEYLWPPCPFWGIYPTSSGYSTSSWISYRQIPYPPATLTPPWIHCSLLFNHTLNVKNVMSILLVFLMKFVFFQFKSHNCKICFTSDFDEPETDIEIFA